MRLLVSVVALSSAVAFAQAGQVSFSAPTYEGLENGGAITVTITRSGGSTGPVSVTWEAYGATASPDEFTGLTGTVSWLDGESGPRTLTITPLADSEAEEDESIGLLLQSPTSGATLGRDSAVVIVRDDDTPTTFALGVNAQSVFESAGVVNVEVRRVGRGGAASVAFTTLNGVSGQTADAGLGISDALAGSDYTTATGVLSWPAGDQTPRTIAVPILNDGLPEPAEAFRVRLSNPSSGSSIVPAGQEIEVLISDDDPTLLATLALTRSSETVTEGPNAMVSVTLNRGGGNSGAISVSFATVGGTAQPGVDFVSSSGTVTWADGDTGAKTLSFSVVDDTLHEGDETFSVVLSRAEGAMLGANASATVTVRDDDPFVDGGTADAGAGGGGAGGGTGGGGEEMPRGCGCGAGEAGLSMLFAAALWLLARRPKAAVVRARK